MSEEEPKLMPEEEAVVVEEKPSSDNNSDEDGVLVEKEEASASASASDPSPSTEPGVGTKEEGPEDGAPQALQIVSIGSEEDQFAFTFHEASLTSILSKIPPGWPVAVVSVVGAFRTGKSFLLSWFLRYLSYTKDNDDSSNNKNTKPWYQTIESLGNDGFEWKGGSDRNTTGIWMWSEPHYISLPDREDQPLAVLLVDSQGMFDHETPMSLTASIFGLSTLLSSYQIYNVDKRIQEDNLQQLALFSEYARIAVQSESNSSSSDDDDKNKKKPFQRMEFLVRDWQHFDDDDDDDLETSEQKEASMQAYLNKVLGEREASDLKETREQILACFEQISCFGLPHPGMKVIKKNFDGSVNAIEEEFLQLLDRYCTKVFGQDTIQPKSIQGREITAVELGAYIKAYAELFAAGADFPEASTMLEATAAANNHNAVNQAIANYKETMDRIAGPKCTNYIKPDELKDHNRQAYQQSVQVFESMATFGSQRSIEKAKAAVMEKLEQDFEMYESLNDSRNPLVGLEM